MKIRFAACVFLIVPSLSAEPVDFNRDVRPILNKNCTACHGGVKQAGEVSFIFREQALAKGESGLPTVVPGKPGESEMMRRILLPADDDEAMPPAKHHPHRLSGEEIEVLNRWIAEGAEWGEHWAFQKPIAPALPEVKKTEWPISRLDHFVLARLETEGLSPSEEAGDSELLRRLSFALNGLPPSAEELRTFSKADLEKKVDELLARPAFGEHVATSWLDVARYADSKGYEKDSPRTMWPYRDWVVKAFNDDLPYNEFVIKQLAGDLLPDATLKDHLATAFLRNSQSNDEGGTDDEEFRIMGLLDRIATIWTGTQGTTFQCVQCHAHPYDPFPHEDFYRFADYFNQTRDGDLPDDYPTLKVPTEEARTKEVMDLRLKVASLSHELLEPFHSLAEQSDWEVRRPEYLWSDKPQAELAEGEVDGHLGVVAKGNVATHSNYEVVFGEGAGEVRAIRVTVPMPSGKSAHTPEEGFAVTTWGLRLRRAGQHEPGKPFESLPIAFVASDEPEGYYRSPQWGAFPNQFHERTVVLVLQNPVVLGADERLSLHLGQGQGRDGAAPPVLRRFYLETTAESRWQELLNEDFQKMRGELDQSERALRDFPGAQVPVLAERTSHKRVMALFERGDFMNKSKVLTGGTPGIFAEKLEGGSRLNAAGWLVDRENPLAARVMVNRIWDLLFGVGLVETLEDFGSTGTPPSHPELLDDLAVRFMDEHKWSVKSLMREIVMSQTYRQSAKANAELVEKDPRNRLMARGPRQRLSAEMLRDHALATAGLLTMKQGGPPVMPPQPEGVWQVVYSGQTWQTPSVGDPQRYRRAVYTYWRRSAPYPAFQTFDAPERRVCSARRIPTNTPLQALIPLNDPAYMEASQALAKAVSSAGDARAQIAEAVLRSTSHEADEEMIAVLSQLLAEATVDFEAHPEDAKVLGSSPEVAAMVIVCNTILNLDSSLTW